MKVSPGCFSLFTSRILRASPRWILALLLCGSIALGSPRSATERITEANDDWPASYFRDLGGENFGGLLTPTLTQQSSRPMRRSMLPLFYDPGEPLPATPSADLIIDQSNNNSPYNYGAGDNTYNNIIVGSQSNGTLNQTGGVLRSNALVVGDSAGSTGLVVLNVIQFVLGDFRASSETIGNAGTGVFTQSGGFNYAGSSLTLGALAGSSGTYNLYRGTVVADRFAGGLGTSIFNFDGGRLRAGASDNPGTTTFFGGFTRANVGNGGVNFDTNGFNVTVAQPLLHSNLGGTNAIDGGLTKNGAGTLTLTGANTYTGGTTVNSGTLKISGNGNLGAAGGAVTSNGGTLDLGGKIFGVGAVTLAGGTIANGLLSGTSFAGQSGAVSAILAGNGVALTKTTAGTLTLSGQNVYTGGTLINEGTLQFAKTNAMPSSGTVSVASGAILGVNAGGTGEFTNSTSGAGSIGGLLAGVGGQGAPVTYASGSFLGIDSTNAPGGNLTYSGIISGARGLATLGSGTLTLTGANTYTGGTQLNGGTLALSGAGTLGSTTGALTSNLGSLNLGGTTQTVGVVTNNGGDILNGTLTGSAFNFLANSTVSAVLAGNGTTLTKLGDNSTTTLAGVNTYTGGTTITRGTLAISGAGTLGNTASTLTAGGGFLDLGGTNQRVGTVNIIGSSDVGIGGVIQNGTLTANSFNFNGNFIPGQDGNSGNANISANLAGNGGALFMNGRKTLVLSGNNTYTGGTFLDNGVLHAASAGALGTTGPVTFNGGLLQLDASSGDYSGRIVNSSTAIFILAASGDYPNSAQAASVTFASSLGSSNTGGLRLFGGTLTLSAPNAFSGPIKLDDSYTYSNLNVTGAGTLGNPTNPLFLYGPGSRLDLGGTSQTVGAINLYNPSDPNFGGFPNGGGGTIQNGKLTGTSFTAFSGTVTADLTVSGGITKTQGDGDSFDTLTFAGNQISTGAVGAKSGFNAVFGGIAFTNGARLDLDSLANGGVNTASYIVDGDRFIIRGGNGATIPPTLSVSGATTALSVGNLSVGVNKFGNVQQDGGSVTATQVLLGGGGSYNLNGGVLKTGKVSGNPSGSGTFNFNGGTLQGSGTSSTFFSNLGIAQVRNGGAKIDTNGFNLTITQPLVHSTVSGDAATDGGLTKAGAGTLVLTGASPNTYTGDTLVNGGVLLLGKANAGPTNDFGAAMGGNLVINNGGTALYGFDSQVPDAKSITVNSGGLLDLNGHAESITNLAVNGGSVSTIGAFSGATGYVNVRGLLSADGSATSSYAGNLHLEAPTAGAARDVSVATGGTFTVSAVVGNGDNGLATRLNKTGAGTLILSGDNAYTGGTTVSAGTLQVGDGGTSGTLGNGGNVTNNAALKFNRADALSVDSIISGSGSLTKFGNGTLTLTGSNTYSGGTTVSAGTLLANNTTGSATGLGSVTVQTGATLGGSGTISGAVTVNNSGTLAPGNSPGQLHLGSNLTLNNGANLAIEIGGLTAGSGYDQVQLAGALTLNTPNLMISVINGYTPNLNDKFYIVDITSLLSSTTGFFGNAVGGTIVNDNSGNSYEISYSDTFMNSTPGNDISLRFLGVTPVPEPSTWAAAALLASALLYGELRRRRGRAGAIAGHACE